MNKRNIPLFPPAGGEGGKQGGEFMSKGKDNLQVHPRTLFLSYHLCSEAGRICFPGIHDDLNKSITVYYKSV